jgi:two-component system, cell cycle sensor histidine kinase and response regulator CckA
MAFERAAAGVTLPPLNDAARELAHDVGNLLTAILGAADAVLERTGIDPETVADVSNIREGARRGAALVQNLRSGAVVQIGSIAVNETIRATSRLLAHRLGADITLTLALGEPDLHVRAHASQLDRVLLNLIANARHAMPAGGTLTLATSRRVVDVAEQGVPDIIPPGDYVAIDVADTGTGIPPDQMSKIFESGVSSWRHGGGSGLGLSSVRGIMRQCAGFLSVASVEGGGARFTIYLPRSEKEAIVPVARVDRAGVSARRVLLVEDDLLVRQVAERVLRRSGWTVLCADAAEEALEIFKQSGCDLLITDLALLGMDGLALVRLIRAEKPELPVIVSSGYEADVSAIEFGTARTLFLTKPYGKEELLETVARIAIP